MPVDRSLGMKEGACFQFANQLNVRRYFWIRESFERDRPEHAAVTLEAGEVAELTAGAKLRVRRGDSANSTVSIDVRGPLGRGANMFAASLLQAPTGGPRPIG